MKHVATIVVNYNSGPYLRKCVDSLLAAKFRDPVEHSIYVVDNLSSDDSMSAVLDLEARSPNISILENKKNIGFAAANNRVLQNVDADYYVLTNPDCQVTEHAISDVIEAMDNDRNLAVASCTIHNIDGSVQKTCKRKFPTPGTGLVRMLGLSRIDPDKFVDFDRGGETGKDAGAGGSGVEYVEAVSGAFFCLRKDALDKIGLLDDGYFMHCEDLDYCMRAKLAGCKVGFVSGAKVMHAKGVSARTAPVRVLWYLHKGMARFYRKFYQKEYPVLVTALVYLGIGVRFIGKTILTVGSRLFAPPRTVKT